MAPRLQIRSPAMSPIRKLSLTAAALALAAAPLFGAARLTYFNNGTLIPVAWPDRSFPIRYSIDRRVTNIVPQAAAILDRAGKDWTGIPDTDIGFQSLGIVDGASAGKDGHNTISIADDLF